MDEFGGRLRPRAFIALAAQQQRPPNPTAWLYRVVRNRACNANRSTRRRANHERLASLLVECTDTSPFKRENEREDEKVELMKSLDELSENQRELIVLRIWSQLKWHEIAELLGTSSSTAQRNYAGALKELKQKLEPCQKNSNCRTI